MAEQKNKEDALKANKVKRFMSCFLCGVEVHDSYIVLTDASERHSFVLKKDNKAAMESFAKWFKEIYLTCVPQQLTVVDYDFVQDDDGQAACIVNRLITKNAASAAEGDSNGKQA